MPRILSRPVRGLLAAVVALAVLAVVAAVLAGGSGRSGAVRQGGRGLIESFFQDDQLLVYSPPQTVARTLDTLRALGVDRLRVTVLWQALAPDPTSTTRPANFDASDPAAYGAAWAPYDRLTQLAAARGVGVAFDVTAPGPLWAMARGAPDAKTATHYRPSASEFGEFVAAVGRRYSGRYVPPGGQSPLPRVSYWTIWNEPNQPGWLAPQWQSTRGLRAVASARVYRGEVDAAFAALERTGHRPASDAILIGELAPEGSESTAADAPVPPIPFLRTLYCVDAGDRELRGAAATAAGCPRAGNRGAFVAAHPGLFQAAGIAHHPYAFFLPPSASMSDPHFVPLSDLGRLERELDRLFALYGVHRQLPIYLTEYGYETNPPNPFRGVSLERQAQYIDQAQYMAWQDPRVRSMAQFLLVDSAPNTAYPRGSLRYWSTFQTGLEFLNGKRKPSFGAYRLPIFLPRQTFSRGGALLVWGMLRPAPNGTTQVAEVQWRSSSGRYRGIAPVRTKDPSGVLSVNVRPPGSGSVRIRWLSSAGAAVYSRAVQVLQRG